MNLHIKDIIEILDLHAPPFKCPSVGQTTGELIFGLHIIRLLRPTTLLEIGSGTGGHIYLLSMVLNRKRPTRIITIDFWPRGTKYFDQYKIYVSCIQSLRKYFPNIDYISIKQPSQSIEALTKLKFILSEHNSMIDFLFIDGSHKKNDVIKDWLNYKDIVDSRGIICFHDIKSERGVSSAWQVINAKFSNYYLTSEINRKGVPLLPGTNTEVELGLGYKYLDGLSQELKEFLEKNELSKR